MLIRLLAVRPGSASLWELDDPSVVLDAGAPMPTPFFETHPIDFGPATGYGRLRRAIQWVALAGRAVVRLIPIADGTRYTEQTYSQTLDVAAGAEQRLEAPFSAPGARFGVRVEIEGASALTEFGEADVIAVPGRQNTGGR
jgi:hypothetical protein